MVLEHHVLNDFRLYREDAIKLISDLHHRPMYRKLTGASMKKGLPDYHGRLSGRYGSNFKAKA